MRKLWRKQTKRWTTRDGTKVRICDMEDSHVLNALRSKGKFYEKFPGIHYDAVFAALVEDAYRRGLMEPDDLTVFGKPSAYSLADLMKKVKK